MTNIREELEKWLEERCTTHAKLNEYRTHLVKEAFESGYQAAHEAQQKRIDDLLEQIEELKSAIKSLCVENDCMSKSIEASTKYSIKQMAEITALESRCRELEDALARLCDSQIDFKLKSDPANFYKAIEIAIKVLSTTGKEVG